MRKPETKAVFCLLVFSFLSALVLFIGSCTTIPKATAQIDNGDFSLIPDGGQLYLWADVNEARPLLESITFEGMSLRQAGDILDRTNTAAAVFSGRAEGSGGTNSSAESLDSRFFINLRGKYPTFGAGFSFTFSKDWKKLKSNTGSSYWYSQNFGIGLALNSQLALVSGGDPLSKTPSASNKAAVRVPGGFDEFRRGSVMAGWIPDSALVNQFLSTLGLPLQIPAEDFFFNVINQKGPDNADLWELTFYIRTNSATQARALVTLFSLARAFISSAVSSPLADKTSITDYLPGLFANTPQQQDSVLTLKSQSFTTRELALLFNAVSVYSGGN